MKVEFKGITEYADKLAKLGEKAQSVCAAALYDMADVYADAIRSETPVSTPDGGDLRDSLVIRPFKREDGVISTKITFEGYDRNGVPNAIKAAVLESGTSDGKHKKTLFLTKAKRKAQKAAEFAFEKKVDEIIKKTMEG